ncbi:transcription termination/antitermination protein NusG [Mycoplana ramosa]|uniref:Transcription termination/antitermination protein NusG n=1 Tax=Mycoplana ramosa TaxID=40837 RepID=A0ABW3YWI9_MYCRA
MVVRDLRAASRSVTESAVDSGRWLCLHVETGREFAVENILSDADVEALAPREKGQFVMRRGVRIQAPDRAFIPSYVFVRCRFSAEAFYGLRRVKHVFDIVGGANGPHVIHDEDISVFKRIAAGLEAPRVATDKTFKDGDRADIVLGPFAGFTCLVLSVKWSRHARARVLINVGGRPFEIDSMPLAFLKKL